MLPKFSQWSGAMSRKQTESTHFNCQLIRSNIFFINFLLTFMKPTLLHISLSPLNGFWSFYTFYTEASKSEESEIKRWDLSPWTPLDLFKVNLFTDLCGYTCLFPLRLFVNLQ